MNKTEELLLSLGKDNYITYKCPTDGIYQIRKDLPKDQHVCPYCKSANPEYTDRW